MERALPDRFGQLYGLACSSDTAFARSWQGRAARLDESGWTPLERVPGPGNSGRPLWVSRDGGVLFTSTQDAIVRYHDGAWTAFEAPLGYDYTNQILSFDGEHAFAVGTGRIVAWSGARYAPYDPGTWRQLHAIGGRAEDDLWVGGEAGAVTHFDGDHFTSHRIDTEGTVIQLWTPAADDLWAVTERPSHVFHRDGDRWTFPPNTSIRVRRCGLVSNDVPTCHTSQSMPNSAQA